jgi:TonB family protein
MDRARVICPSVSLIAHLAGTALLVTGVLVLPGGLPAPTQHGIGVLRVGPALAVSLGRGAPLRAGPRVVHAVARPTLAPTVRAASADAVSVPTVDLGRGSGVIGLPDGGSGTGDGLGLCLSGCGGDARSATSGVGSVLPALPEKGRQGPVRVGGVVRPPLKVVHVAPVYPPLALAARVQGTVVLDCVIDEQGRVASVSILRSLPVLEAAAETAVRQWRYRPTLLDGAPVSVLLTVTVEFRLR